MLVWEKKPTLEEERKAKSLQLPPTFFCDGSADVDSELDRPEDFGTELQKVQQAQVSVMSKTVKQTLCFLFSFKAFLHVLSYMLGKLCLM